MVVLYHTLGCPRCYNINSLYDITWFYDNKVYTFKNDIRSSQLRNTYFTIHDGSGNRGTLLESWTSTESLDVVSAYVTSAESTHTLDEWQWSDTIQDRLVSRTRAYFVPPSDNDYQFVVTADDEAMVWLSPTDDPAAKVRQSMVTPE